MQYVTHFAIFFNKRNKNMLASCFKKDLKTFQSSCVSSETVMIKHKKAGVKAKVVAFYGIKRKGESRLLKVKHPAY